MAAQADVVEQRDGSAIELIRHPKDLRPGDRISFLYGCRDEWGTVTDVEVRTVRDFRGLGIFESAIVTVDCPHLTSYDACGWPVSKPGIVKVELRYELDIRVAHRQIRPPTQST